MSCKAESSISNNQAAAGNQEMPKRKKDFDEVVEQRECAADDPWLWLVHKGNIASFLCIAAFGFLIRVAVSLHSYSGAGTPPKYGDFEAQRHWMEITLNLPVRDWYRNSSYNDLSYWGLDYPPMTAYQSYIHGIFLRFFHPQSVALFTSRGHESNLGKLLMRWTVLSSDALLFFPAVLWFVSVYHRIQSQSQKSKVAWHTAIIMLSPCLILIDHGHFQYNCISLGLTLGAVAAIFSQYEILGCILFSLALNHKQMSAYFAPAFFSHLLGKCLRQKNPWLEVLKLGLAVTVTFMIVWCPYLHSADAFFEVLSRLAPFERGIYEDYVANFWCTTSILVKWKKLFTIESLKLLSLSATILACIPSMLQQVLTPSNEGFLYSLLNTSMAFYLLSYQVHEKSILLPLLPGSLLALKMPNDVKNLTQHALFSMYPLLCRDKLILPYVSLHVLFLLLFNVPGRPREMLGTVDNLLSTFLQYLLAISFKFTCLCSLILHIIYLTVEAPPSYPFLYEALIMLLSFSYFVTFTLYTNSRQWALSRGYRSKRHFRANNLEKKIS